MFKLKNQEDSDSYCTHLRARKKCVCLKIASYASSPGGDSISLHFFSTWQLNLDSLWQSVTVCDIGTAIMKRIWFLHVSSCFFMFLHVSSLNGRPRKSHGPSHQPKACLSSPFVHVVLATCTNQDKGLSFSRRNWSKLRAFMSLPSKESGSGLPSSFLWVSWCSWRDRGKGIPAYHRNP